MTGHAAARRRPRMRLVIASVAALTGLLMASSAVQPAMASTVREAGSVSAGRAGSPAAPQAAIGGDIQSILLKFAAQKLAGFAFNKLGLDKLLGDSSGQQLADLQAKLNQISAQIQILQNSLNQLSAELAKASLQGFTVPLGMTVSKIKSLYIDFYLPTLNALTAYVTVDLAAKNDGSTCDDVMACTDARGHYDTLRGEFLKQFTAEGPASYNIQIHDALLPGPAGSSVMTAYGLVLAKSGTGFLTSADSAAVLDFYNYFADYEALAAWMKAQWNSDRFALDPAEFDRFLQEQIFGYQDQEHKALPPPIPAGTVIVLPANAAERTNSTVNLPMWGFSGATGYGSWPSPYAKAGTAPFVPAEIDQLNTTAAGYGFKDWKVPSRSELDALLSRGPANTTAKDFLLSLDPAWQKQNLLAALTTAPYIWTTQDAGSPPWAGSPVIVCTGLIGLNVYILGFPVIYSHTAVGPVTNSLSGYPAQYKNYNRPDLRITEIKIGFVNTAQMAFDKCNTALSDAITKFFTSGSPTVFGTLLVRRGTGNVNYLPG